MYILFEKCSDDSDESSIYSFDAIGYTDTEYEAYIWVAEKEECRTCKYCPNSKTV